MDVGTAVDLQSFEEEKLVARMTEVAAAERQQAVQKMLSKQLDTGGSLEEQIQRQKSFIKGSTVKTISDHTKGQLSLRDFVSVQEEHQAVDDLRDCGLTDQEIAFKLEQEGRTLTIIQSAKRGNLSVDPVVQSKRLKAVDSKISQQLEEKAGCSRLEHLDETPDVSQPVQQPRKGIFSQLSLSRKFTHPDDPINHLHLIEAELFRKMAADKDPPVYQGCDPKPLDEEGGQVKESLPDKAKADCVSGDGISCLSHDQSHLCSQFKSLSEEGDCRPQDSHESVAILVGKDGNTHCHKSFPAIDKNVVCGANQKLRKPSSSTSQTRCGCSGITHQCLTDSNSRPVCTGQNTQLSKCEKPHETNQEQANRQESPRQLYGRVSAISMDDIKRNRLTVDEIRQLDRFKDYSPGSPSKILYLKNLSRQVCEEDLVSLFIHFQSRDKPKLVFKLLTGRMRGQAFITFPDIDTASSAIQLVNGYNLKGKPMIIQYGRQQQR